MKSRIDKIRDMNLYREYWVIPNNTIMRVYTTRRSGIYGHQFAAIIWELGKDPVGSSNTNGCGYDKVGACCAEAARLAGWKHEVVRMFDGGSIENGLAAQFELKDVFSEIHCAHA